MSNGLKPDIDQLVDKFLQWELPHSVNVDPICYTGTSEYRTGTNLLTAIEARQMFEYLSGEVLPTPATQSAEDWVAEKLGVKRLEEGEWYWRGGVMRANPTETILINLAVALRTELEKALRVALENANQYPDTEAGGVTFCGKCGKRN